MMQSGLAFVWALGLFPCQETEGAPSENRQVLLEVSEHDGVERRNEIVTSGVPFPQGAVRTVQDLGLRDDAGKEVPCQFTPLARWDDGSLQWVLLEFTTDLPAGAKKSYRLDTGTKSGRRPIAPSLSVRDDGSAILVDTGALRFRVPKDSFVLMDRTRVKTGTGWTSPTGAGAAIVVDASGKRFGSELPGEGTEVKVERSGALSAVIRCSGTHRARDGGEMFRYVARLRVHAGSSAVRLFYTFINTQKEGPPPEGEGIPVGYGPGRDAHPPALDPVRGVELQVPAPRGARRFSFGLPGRAPVSGNVAKGEIVDLLQTGPEVSRPKIPFLTRVRRRVKGADERLFEGPGRSPGWVDLTGNRAGLTASVRWFWQQHPKQLSVSAEGFRVGLWPINPPEPPRRYPHFFRQGFAKTHEVLLQFHPGSSFPAESARVAAAFQYRSFPKLLGLLHETRRCFLGLTGAGAKTAHVLGGAGENPLVISVYPLHPDARATGRVTLVGPSGEVVQTRRVTAENPIVRLVSNQDGKRRLTRVIMEGTDGIIWNLESSEHRIVLDARKPVTVSARTSSPACFFMAAPDHETVEIRLRGEGSFRAALYDPSGVKAADLGDGPDGGWRTLSTPNTGKGLWMLRFQGERDITVDLSRATKTFSSFRNQFFDLSLHSE